MKTSFHTLRTKDEKLSFATADFSRKGDNYLGRLKAYLSPFGNEGIALSGLLECPRGAILGIRYVSGRDGRKALSFSRKPRTGIQLILRTQILGRHVPLDIFYGENVLMLQDVLSIEQFICLHELSNAS